MVDSAMAGFINHHSSTDWWGVQEKETKKESTAYQRLHKNTRLSHERERRVNVEEKLTPSLSTTSLFGDTLYSITPTLTMASTSSPSSSSSSPLPTSYISVISPSNNRTAFIDDRLHSDEDVASSESTSSSTPSTRNSSFRDSLSSLSVSNSSSTCDPISRTHSSTRFPRFPSSLSSTVDKNENSSKASTKVSSKTATKASSLVPTKLLFFGAILVLSIILPNALSDGNTKPCSAGQRSCGDCIQIGPHCSWCADESFNSSRCSEAHSTCKSLQKVKSTQVKTQDEQLRDGSNDHKAVQMRPQKVNVKLQIGKTETVEVTFKPAKDYPVDLYYLMDLSRSMEDDKEKLAELGEEIGRSLSSLTKSVKMGFGTFVDKPVMPYVSIAANGSLRSPCDYRLEQKMGYSCDLPYTFKNKLSLTKDLKEFRKAVKGTRISGNLDGPEGGLEAMMQVIVCDKEIGWRETSRKLIVYSSDAAFHTAGDGLLGGIVEPNDGKCHLQDNHYTMATEMDYPSIGQIADALAKKKITAIFAVMEDVEDIYNLLKDELEGARVGRITNDSNNIVDIVVRNYEEIKQSVKLQLKNSIPGIQVKFTAMCENDGKFDGDACSGVKIGEEVKFQVKITLNEKICQGESANKEHKLVIEPLGIPEKIIIKVRPICQCECESPKFAVQNSPKCSNGNGTFECGQCTCNEGRYGQICQCSGTDVKSNDHKALCKRPDLENPLKAGIPLCSGHGECVCGKCECTDKSFTGKYCQCNVESCPRFQQRVCSGKDHGICSCDGEGDIATCKCLPGWTGRDCSCPESEADCMNDGKVCSNHGTCKCHKSGREVIRKCDCDEGYFGTTCESTTGIGCEQYRLCVLCDVHYDPATMSNECSEVFINGTNQVDFAAGPCKGIKIARFENLDSPSGVSMCRFDLNKRCRFRFLFNKENGSTIINAETKEICSESFNLPLTISAIAGAIVAIGLAALLIWRLVTYISDIREFARFEEEKKKRKWAPVNNALYQPPVTTIINPAYKRKGGPNMYS